MNRRIGAFLLILIEIVSCLFMSGCSSQYDNNYSYQAPTVFIQFFDWFHENQWKEDEFVDPIDWERIGIYNDDRESKEFYYKMFSYIKSMGVDALAWEYHPRKGEKPLWPSENAIEALRESGLKIACFYDLEIALKVRYDDKLIATLSNSARIKASPETIKAIVADLKEFYEHVPSDLLAYDKDGMQVIYVFGYDFDDSNIDISKWDYFGETLLDETKEYAGSETRFYWTCKNSVFEEHLFQHFDDRFVPFQFVLDNPQSQFSNASVTWNLGFDNLGVQERDKLQRVIRLDQRYIEEMGWLAKASNASALFIYSWNEPFEGSMAIPTEYWGDTKAKLVKEFIDRLKYGDDEPLRDVALIVDDFDDYLQGNIDWHYELEREMLLYSFRRFLPQADVFINSEIMGPELDGYLSVVDLSFDKNPELDLYLNNQLDNKQIVYFDPKAAYVKSSFTSNFIDELTYLSINDEVPLYNSKNNLFVRDDVAIGKKTNGTVSLCDIIYKDERIPIVLKNSDDLWICSYGNNEYVFKVLFEDFYQQGMSISVMYGEGLNSQRLEIEPSTFEIKKNTLQRYSVNQHWNIPDGIKWNVMPKDIDEEYYSFVFFGID